MHRCVLWLCWLSRSGGRHTVDILACSQLIDQLDARNQAFSCSQGCICQPPVVGTMLPLLATHMHADRPSRAASSCFSLVLLFPAARCVCCPSIHNFPFKMAGLQELPQLLYMYASPPVSTRRRLVELAEMGRPASLFCTPAMQTPSGVAVSVKVTRRAKSAAWSTTPSKRAAAAHSCSATLMKSTDLVSHRTRCAMSVTMRELFACFSAQQK